MLVKPVRVAEDMRAAKEQARQARQALMEKAAEEQQAAEAEAAADSARILKTGPPWKTPWQPSKAKCPAEIQRDHEPKPSPWKKKKTTSHCTWPKPTA